MADTDMPVDKVKSLDGSVSEPIGNDLRIQSANNHSLPSRFKEGKDEAPPGQTLTGKQEHCTRGHPSVPC